MTAEELQKPPTEIETAEALAAIKDVAHGRGIDVIRRLAFQRDKLDSEVEYLRDVLEDLGCYEMKWRMMPNGMRGWYCDGYLTDAKMDAWCNHEAMVTPEVIEREHRT